MERPKDRVKLDKDHLFNTKKRPLKIEISLSDK